MTTTEIRKAFLDFMAQKGHTIIPRANLVPQNDPTTLFTGSGMQPLVAYLLGEEHPEGNKVANSQTCLRAEDIEEVGDLSHTTFFEMLGNWSFGDYFKDEQLAWFFEFLTDIIGLDPKKLYVTCFAGDKEAGIPTDGDSAKKWSELFALKNVSNKVVKLGSPANAAKTGMQSGRIFYYDASKNWWSRAGEPKDMPAGEPGGPDSEIFYEFDHIEHNKKYGEHCHPNCKCGRYLEIGNSVFMQYLKQTDDKFELLPKQNVDFGGGLERIAAAEADDPDIFKIDLLWPIVEKLQDLSKKDYKEHTHAMRVIADHLRAAVWLAADGVVPSNKMQGYVMRRLVRRAIRYARQIGIENNFTHPIAEIIIETYQETYKKLNDDKENILEVLEKEENAFARTISEGLKKTEKMLALKTPIQADIYSQIMEYSNKKEAFREIYKHKDLEDNEFSKNGIPIVTKDLIGATVSGAEAFDLYQTYGFPIELIVDLVQANNLLVDIEDFEREVDKHKEQSRTASAGMFRGGLADSGEMTTKYHTAAHLLMAALRQVLGEHVSQKGSNITAERLRLDFSHSEKVTPEQIAQVEKIVNEKIQADLPITCSEQNTKDAIASGAAGAFGHKYGDKVKVYEIGDFSKEICGGPHIDHTGQLGENGQKFKIVKEESSSAGVRRIKAVLV
jgi:alanyl-tRNA synthetase